MAPLLSSWFFIGATISFSMVSSTPAAAALNNLYTDCGGIVRVTVTDNPSIEYKHGESYDKNERCVWTILPEPGLSLGSLILVVENQNFFPGDGLTVYTWPNNNGDLVARKILETETGVAITLPATSHAFLYFSSSATTTGLGFKVDVIGVEGESSGLRHDAQFLDAIQCFKRFYYPKFPAIRYDDNARMSVVLQHSDATVATIFDIGYLDLENTYDVLRIFDLMPYNEEPQFILEATHTGSHPEGFNSTESFEPRLLLFSTDSSSSGRGFHFDWY